MIPKDINQITELDLIALIENETYEKKEIDYKQALFLNTDNEKKEFLADVSSFANTIGGDLIIGITEDKLTGKPKALIGVPIENPDQEKLKIENIIQSGIRPRIPLKDIIFIKLTNGNLVFIIRIHKSWISPHRITFNGWDKFYSRNSAGKYPLDVDELRIAFILSETLNKEIDDFKQKRLSKIIPGDTPVVLCEGPKIILHLLPLESFSRMHNYDLTCIDKDQYLFTQLLQPINHTAHYYRFNYDGFLTYSQGANGFNAYAQLFRNGIIEAVEAYMLGAGSNKKFIPIKVFEEEVVSAVSRYLAFMQKIGVSQPILLGMTLVGVRGLAIIHANGFPFADDHPIDRDILQFPYQIINNYSEKAEEILYPSFNALWNSAGHARDPYYDNDGKWKHAKK